jgi:phosphoribosylaminoimidazole (AIR) synthetase
MVEDWLKPVKDNIIEYLTSYDFTPEIVEELAEEIVEDAQLDDVVLIGGEDAVMKYLRKIVEK